MALEDKISAREYEKYRLDGEISNPQLDERVSVAVSVEDIVPIEVAGTIPIGLPTDGLSLALRLDDIAQSLHSIISLLKVLNMHQEQITGLEVSSDEVEHANND